MNKHSSRDNFDILKRTIILLSILYLFLINLTYSQSWTELTWSGNTPTSREGHSAVYDATNNLMTIFGGIDSTGNLLNDTWVFVNANGLGGANFWTQLFPTGSIPTTRYGHTSVYDNTHNRMTIFGGNSYQEGYLNDLWVLSNANGLGGTPTWTEISTIGSIPLSREGHTAVYDDTNNRMIIFGGWTGDYFSSDSYLNDAWVLSNANGYDSTTSAWTKLYPTGSAPTSREYHSAVYDAANNRMIIFGGWAGPPSHQFLNDIWVLSNANGLSGTPTWTQITTFGNAPTIRYKHTAIYDVSNNLMTIFGGTINYYSTITDTNDVWVFSHANGLGSPAWTQLYLKGIVPVGRFGHTSIYDKTNNRMIIFAGGFGNNGANVLNDVWVLSTANDGITVPISGFYSIPTSGIGPLNINFTDTSANVPSNWAWDFGDGNTDNEQSPTHIYNTVSAPTSYTIQLVVSNAYGTSTSTHANYIYVYETVLKASFAGTPLFGYSPMTVYFSDSSYIYGNNPSWNWSFGDGSTSNIQNPIHVYGTVSSATTYTVQLIVTTSLGTSTSTQNNYVIVLPKPAVEDWMLYSTELQAIEYLCKIDFCTNVIPIRVKNLLYN